MKNYFYLLPVLFFLLSCQKEEIKEIYSISGTVGLAPQQVLPGQDTPVYKINLIESGQILSTQTGYQYWFTNLEEGKSYTIVPYVSEGNPEGITTIDLIILIKYLEGLQQLDALQQIAADIDKNNIIDQTDVDLLSACIIEWECFSYRFISPDYTGPGSSYLDQYTIENINGNHVVDFRPIKLGDVNHSF